MTILVRSTCYSRSLSHLSRFLEVYQGPTASIQNLAARTLLSGSIPPWSNPCPGSTLCSYNQTFFAPSFNCSQPQNVTDLFNGIPLARWSASVETGLERDFLSVTWVSNLNETATVLSTNCTSYNSTYDVTISFREEQSRGTIPDIVVNRITLEKSFGTADPRNWSMPVDAGNSSVGGNPFGTFNPNQTIPYPKTRLKTTQLLSLGQAFLSSIKDAVTTTFSGNILFDPDVGLLVPDSALVMFSPAQAATSNGSESRRSLFFNPDIDRIIQDTLTNTTLSLLSLHLWTTTVPTTALTGIEGPGNGEGAGAGASDSQPRTQALFIYDPLVLWIGYSICIGLTLIIVIIGLYSASKNGGSRDTRFSTVVRSVTGNRVLDKYMELRERDLALVSASSLGSEDALRKEFLELKLRYGRVGMGGPNNQQLGVQVEDDRLGPGLRRSRMVFGIETQLGKEDR